MEPCTVVAARAWGRINQALACRICNKRQRDPKSLACRHSFCAACLQRVSSHGGRHQGETTDGKTEQHHATEARKDRPNKEPNPDQADPVDEQESHDGQGQIKNDTSMEIACPTCCRVTSFDARTGLPDAANLIAVLGEAEKQERFLMGQPQQQPCCLDETEQSLHKAVCGGLLGKHRLLSAGGDRHRDIRLVLRRNLAQRIQFLRSLGRMFVIRPRSLWLIVLLSLVYITLHPVNKDSGREGTWILIRDYIPVFGELEEKPISSNGPAIEESSDDKPASNSDDIISQLHPAVANALSRLSTMSERVESKISQMAYEAVGSIIDEEAILRETLEKVVDELRSKIQSYDVHLQAYSSIRHADELGEDFQKLRIEAEAETLRALHRLSFVALRYPTESASEYIGKLSFQNSWKLERQFYLNGIYRAKAIGCYPNGDVAVLGDRQVRVYQANGQYKFAISSQHLREPSGLVVTNTGSMYVTDGKRVKVFDDNLKFLFKFTSAEGDKLTRSSLTCVAITSEDHVVVCDRGRQLISIHSSSGVLLKTIPAPLLDEYITVDTDEQWFAYTNANSRRIVSVDQKGIEVFGIETSKNGAAPAGIACDEFGDIYIALVEAHYLQHGQYLVDQEQPVLERRFGRQVVAHHESKRYAVQRYSQSGIWLGGVRDIQLSYSAAKALTFGVNGDLLVSRGETVYVYKAT